MISLLKVSRQEPYDNHYDVSRVKPYNRELLLLVFYTYIIYIYGIITAAIIPK